MPQLHKHFNVIGNLRTFMMTYIFLIAFYISNGTIPSENVLYTKYSQQLVINHFIPDGYYFSKDSIHIKGASFGWLSIFTQDAKAGTVAIRLIKPDGKWIEIESYKHKIVRDASYFYFQHKFYGKVVIEGRFIGQNGPMEDKVKVKETIVFNGKLMVDGRSSPLQMTWWEGD